MTWLPVPQAIVLATTTLISAVIAYTAWRRRNFPVENRFFWFILAVTEWTFAYTFEAAAVDPSIKILWTQIGYIGLVSIPPLMLMFVMEYTEHRSPPRYVLFLAWTLSIITLLLAWTNAWHGLLWSEISVGPKNENILIYQHGPWFWVSAAYYYAFIFATIIILLNRYINSSPLDRRRVGVMILGSLFPFAGGLIYAFNIGPIPNLDWSALSCAGMSIIFAWNIFRFQMLDLVPVARGNIFENLDEGLIVLNTESQVVDINPAALNLFKLANRRVIGEPIDKLSPLLAQFVHQGRRYAELVQDKDTATWLDLHGNPLYDQRGNLIGRLIIVYDISVRKRAEEALRESEQRYRLLADHSNDVIWTMGLDGKFSYVSPSVFQLRGYTPEEVLQQSLDQVVCPASLASIEERLSYAISTEFNTVQQQQPTFFEIEQPRKDGSTVWTEVTARLMYDEAGKPLELVGVSRNITERKRLKDVLQQQAATDELTGVPNRRHFIFLAQNEIKRARRFNRPLTFALIDIDHFKQINDTYGHASGDLVLVAFAKIWQRSMREIDVFARFGGDEFIMLMPETNCEQGYKAVERIRLIMTAQPFNLGGIPVSISISSGIASLARDEVSLDMVIQRADQALYQAKAAGRNRVAVESLSFPKSEVST